MRVKRLNRREMFECRPIRHPSLDWEKNQREEVIIEIPLKKNFWARLLTKFFFLPERKKINLDRIGSEVWMLCDGKNTVRNIVKILRKRYNLSRKEAEVSTLEYLRRLTQKGIIGLELKGDKNE